MITIIYRVSCDSCGHVAGKSVDVKDLSVMDVNSQDIIDFMTPSLPDGWQFIKSKIEGEADKVFCCWSCKKIFQERMVIAL